MISYKELKIDNWVSAPTLGYCQVYGLEMKSDGEEFAWLFRNGITSKHRVSLKDIDPIVITHELLANVTGLPFEFEFGVFTCSMTDDGKVCLEQYGEGAQWIDHIENVHQVQNLFFSLTGRDLQISFKDKSI